MVEELGNDYGDQVNATSVWLSSLPNLNIRKSCQIGFRKGKKISENICVKYNKCVWGKCTFKIEFINKKHTN